MSQVVAGEDNTSVPNDEYVEVVEAEEDRLYIYDFFRHTCMHMHICWRLPARNHKDLQVPVFGSQVWNIIHVINNMHEWCMHNYAWGSTYLGRVGSAWRGHGTMHAVLMKCFSYRSMVNCRMISLYCHGQIPQSLRHHRPRSAVLNRLCRCCGVAEWSRCHEYRYILTWPIIAKL